MNAQEQAAETRRFAGTRMHDDRGLIAVRGSDRVRWLDGMVSNDVSVLAPGPERSGCYATLLTTKGRIIADLHVLLREGEFWLETSRDAVARVIECLTRYIIADDVELEDISDAYDRVGFEGPGTLELMKEVSGPGPELEWGSCADFSIAGVDFVVAAFGWSGERALQIFGPKGSAEAIRAALVGADRAPVDLDRTAMEILRIEAGIPRLGSELDEDVFPDEAGLGHAISITKGCYMGQEIVARLRSRGHVNHRLVGLRFGSSEPPTPDTELFSGEKRTGEVTSVCVSPSMGIIGLGYVRVDDADPGRRLSIEGSEATVAELPFVPLDGGGPSAGATSLEGT